MLFYEQVQETKWSQVMFHVLKWLKNNLKYLLSPIFFAVIFFKQTWDLSKNIFFTLLEVLYKLTKSNLKNLCLPCGLRTI